MEKLTLHNFSDLFGTTHDQFSAECRKKILEHDWSYYPIEGEERDRIMLDLLMRIEQRKLSIVANEDKTRWLNGWEENLQEFYIQNGAIEALLPKYIRANQPIRLFGQFVRTLDPYFEQHWYEIFREWFFTTYLGGFDHIFEFGCGSGFNVAELARIYPSSTIYGLDWVQPSIDIINELHRLKNLKVYGRLFDFFHPDQTFDIPPNSAILTIGALEQTGTNWQQFLEYLLIKKPKRVFHIEPIYEWYEESNLFDYTAMRIHTARNFWHGFLPKLLELAQEGRIIIHRKKRANFGSLLLEGYSQLIWSPL